MNSGDTIRNSRELRIVSPEFTDPTRRLVLKAAIALPWMKPAASLASAEAGRQGIMIGACSDHDDKHFQAIVNLDTAELSLVPLEQRGHDLVPHPRHLNLAVSASRRPGNTLTLTDITSGEILARTTCRRGRHFYGHLAFSATGEQVLTTENEFESGRGLVSIRDSQTLKTIEEMESFGIGPHDLQLLPQGDVLVIANGGIRTHPDSGRRKLNLASMHPSLVYIDLPGFSLLDSFELPDPKLSIRHIDIDAEGRVGIASQYQSRYASRGSDVPLVALNRHCGGQPQLLALPNDINARLNRYTADFCFDATGAAAAISSPPGNLVVIIDTRTNSLLRAIDIIRPSALGLSRDSKYFVVSTAEGEIHFINTTSARSDAGLKVHLPGLKWDNHMRVI